MHTRIVRTTYTRCGAVSPPTAIAEVLAYTCMMTEHVGRSTASELRETLRQRNLRANKRMGQHFLVDRGILRSIAASADLTETDTVIEVGPGTGLLTSELQALCGEVIAVELDRQLVTLLRDTFATTGNVVVVEGDILTMPPAHLLAQHSVRGSTSYKVVANLPYYITSPVLRHFLHSETPPWSMIVMVQEEVGRAIMAKPGDMSLLSVGIQAFARPSVVRRVSARSFHPHPKVDSMVLRLETIPTPPIRVEQIPAFLDFVGAGFHSPRKQLRNSFGHGLTMERVQIDELLSAAGVAPTRRPETLTVDDWVQLWRLYKGMLPGESPC